MPEAKDNKGRGGGPVAVADRVVQEQDRDAGGEQGDEVGDEEGPTAALVGDPREPPDVAQPDGGSDRRHQKARARPPLLARLLDHVQVSSIIL